MSERKPIPYQPATKSRVCPVCGKPSYSQSGMHPQCAMARADASTKAERKAAEAVQGEERRNLFSKPCPKCKCSVPARRYTCDCGHRFVLSPAAKPQNVPVGGRRLPAKTH